MKVRNFVRIFWIIALWSSIVHAAQFSLVPQKIDAIVNCPTDIEIRVDTQWQNITAADMILRYNEYDMIIEWLVPGNAFEINWWLKKERNRLRSTALNYSNPLNGTGIFWILTITPKKMWESKIIFEVHKLSKDSTLDTNMAYEGKDHLTAVQNAFITVHSGICPNKNIDSDEFIVFDTEQSYEEFAQIRLKKFPKTIQKQNITEATQKKYMLGIVLVLIFVWFLWLRIRRWFKEDK